MPSKADFNPCGQVGPFGRTFIQDWGGIVDVVGFLRLPSGPSSNAIIPVRCRSAADAPISLPELVAYPGVGISSSRTQGAIPPSRQWAFQAHATDLTWASGCPQTRLRKNRPRLYSDLRTAVRLLSPGSWILCDAGKGGAAGCEGDGVKAQSGTNRNGLNSAAAELGSPAQSAFQCFQAFLNNGNPLLRSSVPPYRVHQTWCGDTLRRESTGR